MRNRWFGPSEVDFPAANVVVSGVAIVDNQTSHTMKSGVCVTNRAGYAATAVIVGNQIQGTTVGHIILNNATSATVTVVDTPN